MIAELPSCGQAAHEAYRDPYC